MENELRRINVHITLLWAMVIILCVGAIVDNRVHAQNPNISPVEFTVGGPSANCVVNANETSYCFGNDKFVVSVNGGAFAAIPAAPSGVQSVSINGTSKNPNSAGAVAFTISEVPGAITASSAPGTIAAQ
jgi:hypothetical protein